MIKNLVYTEEMNRILDSNKSLESRFKISFELESLLKSEYFTELSANGREFLGHYDV